MKNLLNYFQTTTQNPSITFYLLGIVSIVIMIVIHRLSVKNRKKDYSFQSSFVFLLTLVNLGVFIAGTETELPFAFGSGLFAMIAAGSVVLRNQNIKYLAFYILMTSNLTFTFLQM